MADVRFENSRQFAIQMDERDPLRTYRSQFHFPKAADGSDANYLTGHSLGLQPKKAKAYIEEELERWSRLAVAGHFSGERPWTRYQESLTEPMARLVGARPHEVVVMNTLTVNLHLMMVSFYRPTKSRYKILVEANAFPSDQYAVASQIRFHGFDPKAAIIEVSAFADPLEAIEEHGDEIALVLLGNVNYLTGRAFDMKPVVQSAHAKGCKVGFDLAHGAGNLRLSLHDDGPDFAVWCTYKYLNSGPGALAGCFVHERHAKDRSLPRFAGWWGHNKATRFKMGPDFDPIEGAEGWQLSNAPIFQLAAMRASMELFDSATMSALREKGDRLTGFLEHLLDQLPNEVTIVTPRDRRSRGSQLSLRVNGDGRKLLEDLNSAGIICDFREPDILRAAPAPIYNSFEDVYRFYEVLAKNAS